jgi:branched-chain amino acid transport system ATP-binding protein
VGDPLLRLDGVAKSYGSLRVVVDLDLEVRLGEALGVVGPNGAGKTTLLNLVAGTVPMDAGRVVFGGVDITGMPPHARCRAGIGRTHQIPLPFEDLSVFENVLVGARFGRTDGEGQADGAAYGHLETVGLAGKANVAAGALTLLERKRLELARALATEPRLLLLDEIAGGLTEAEVQTLLETIGDLRRHGVTIVWIEHVVSALLSVVDRLMAMDFGKKLIEGDPQEVMSSPEVQMVYLGVEEQ